MQQFTVDGSMFVRAINLTYFSKNPADPEKLIRDRAYVAISETIVEVNEFSFAVLDFNEFGIFNGPLQFHLKNPQYRRSLMAKGMQELRREIEWAVNEILGGVMSDHPQIAYEDEDGNPLHQLDDEILFEGFRKMQASSAPVQNIRQEAQINFDPATLTGLTPEQQKALVTKWQQQQQGLAPIAAGQVPPTIQPMVTPIAAPAAGVQIPQSGAGVPVPAGVPAGLEA